MKKRRVHRLLHIVCITGMMLSLCGCSSTKAKETDALIEAIAMDSRIAADPAPFIVLSQYKDSCIEYIVRVWCNNADYWDVFFGLNENVRECFARHGVQMTYNHINVHMMDK